MPILLNRQEIASLLTLDDALTAAREAFLALARDQVVMPERIATRVEAHEGTHLSMPCYVRTGEREVLCTKIATVFERNPKRGLPTTMAFLTLQDPETGELLALMDAEHLTALRTAAASALAIDLLADSQSDTLTLFGVGGQAEAHLPAVLNVRPVKRVFVIARELSRAEAFCDQHRGAGQLIPTNDREMAVRQSQIVCTTTNSKEPVFEGVWLQPGAVVTAVGAFRADMREVDDWTVERAFVVVDRLEAAQRGAGDLIQAAADWSRVVTLGDLLNGSALTHAPEQPRLFKSVGLAVQDAFIAALAYEKARNAGLGISITLQPE